MDETLKHSNPKQRDSLIASQLSRRDEFQVSCFAPHKSVCVLPNWEARQARYESEFQLVQEELDYLQASEQGMDELSWQAQEVLEAAEKIFSCKTRRVANPVKGGHNSNEPKPLLHSKRIEVDPDADILYDIDEEIVYY